MATSTVLDKDTLAHQLGFDTLASPEEANDSPPEPANAVITDVECSAATLTPSPDEAEAQESERSQVPADEYALAKVQETFFLLETDAGLEIGEFAQLNQRSKKGAVKPAKFSKQPVGNLKIRRFLRAHYPAVDDSQIARTFMVDPNTTIYTGIEFHPTRTTPGHLNLYVGPVISPVEGDCTEIDRFLFEVICDGDWQVHAYLNQYLAHAYQKPEEKPGVFLILIGGQGIGKGTFLRLIQQIWQATYLQVNKAEMIVGRFNAILARAFWAVVDEGLFSGNRQLTDRLKSLVTEPEIVVEAKYQPSLTIDSHHRFVMTTNAHFAKNTEYDDRRDFTLRVSEKYKHDHEYWQQLNRDINPSSLAAFVYKLAQYDLTDFNVRNIPHTAEKLQQKIHSLGAIESYWYQCLDDGSIDDSSGWPAFVASEDLLEGVIAHWGRFHKKPLMRDVVQTLRILCPSVTQGQQGSTPKRRRGLVLPPLPQARGEFETWIGCKIDW